MTLKGSQLEFATSIIAGANTEASPENKRGKKDDEGKGEIKVVA